METTMYYDYPFESYACRVVADPDKDDYEMFGKFYTEKEQSRETKPLRTKLDTDAVTRGEEISKQEYEAL